MHFGIYLQFKNGNKYSGLDFFKKICKEILGEDTYILIVDNSGSASNYSDHPTDKVIEGNNEKREFSGYQAGFNYLTENFNLDDNSIIAFANDTFNVNYTGSECISLFQTKRARSEILKGSLVGYVDRLSENVRLMDQNGDYWVRTSFFTIGIRNLIRLLPFGRGFNSSEFFSSAREGFFSESAIISENYKNFLKAWLFKSDNSFKIQETWHSAQTLTSENFNQFKTKTQCIFSEFLFSQEAISKNIRIFDVRLFLK